MVLPSCLALIVRGLCILNRIGLPTRIRDKNGDRRIDF